MNEYISEWRPEDIWYVAHHMRSEDVEECAAGGLDPLSALRKGWQLGDAWTLKDRLGNPAAILGVHSVDNPAYGVVWLLGTPSIEKYPMTFARNSKPVLDMLFKDYELLYNSAYYKNEVHLKWLKWLGFTLAERQGDWVPFFKWRS